MVQAPEDAMMKPNEHPSVGSRNYWKAMVARKIIEHQHDDPEVISKKKEFRVREHDNMFWKMEMHMMMHDLAYEFFWQRAFILNLLILLLGVTISIIGVLSSGGGGVTLESVLNGTDLVSSPTEAPVDDFDEELFAPDGNTTRFLQEVTAPEEDTIDATKVIAILGILITFLKSFEKYFNYQSRSDLHESAVTTLKDITDELYTTRTDVDLLVDEYDDDESPKKQELKEAMGTDKEAELVDDIEDAYRGHRESSRFCKAKFDTMQKACTDPIPPAIIDHFAELEEVLKFASYDLKFYFFRRYYHKIAARLRESNLRCSPPCFLDCFETEDIYEELYQDVCYFFTQTEKNIIEKEQEEEEEEFEKLRKKAAKDKLVDTLESDTQVV